MTKPRLQSTKHNALQTPTPNMTGSTMAGTATHDDIIHLHNTSRSTVDFTQSHYRTSHGHKATEQNGKRDIDSVESQLIYPAEDMGSVIPPYEITANDVQSVVHSRNRVFSPSNVNSLDGLSQDASGSTFWDTLDEFELSRLIFSGDNSSWYSGALSVPNQASDDQVRGLSNTLDQSQNSVGHSMEAASLIPSAIGGFSILDECMGSASTAPAGPMRQASPQECSTCPSPSTSKSSQSLSLLPITLQSIAEETVVKQPYVDTDFHWSALQGDTDGGGYEIPYQPSSANSVRLGHTNVIRSETPLLSRASTTTSGATSSVLWTPLTHTSSIYSDCGEDGLSLMHSLRPSSAVKGIYEGATDQMQSGTSTMVHIYKGSPYSPSNYETPYYGSSSIAPTSSSRASYFQNQPSERASSEQWGNAVPSEPTSLALVDGGELRQNDTQPDRLGQSALVLDETTLARRNFPIQGGKKRKRDISPIGPHFTRKSGEITLSRPPKEGPTGIPSWEIHHPHLSVSNAVGNSSCAEGLSGKETKCTSRGLDSAVKELGDADDETLVTDGDAVCINKKAKDKRRKQLAQVNGMLIGDDIASLIKARIRMSYHENNSYTCPLEGCERVLARDQLGKHYRDSHYSFDKDKGSQSSFCCPKDDCKSSFKYISGLTRHLSGVHLGAFDLFCGICKDRFRRDTLYEIRRHAGKHHTKEMEELSEELGYDVMTAT